MDDILKDNSESGATTQPVDLSDLVEVHPLTTSVPVPAVRNRAAITALLTGDPNTMVEKYRLLMQEGMEGKDVTQQEAQQAIDARNQSKNMRHVINILGDNTIPLEQKKQLMDFVKQGGLKEEPAVTIQTAALEAPSKGEDLRGESARISLAETMSEIHREAQYRQKVMNGLIATLPEASARTVGELAQTEVMPFGRNVIAAKIAGKLDELSGQDTSMGTWIKRFLLPGSTEAEVQQRLLSVPPEMRDPITQKIKQAIKESASVFPSENYYAQWQEAMNLLDSPTHSNADIWTKNMMTLFDMFWVGSEVRSLMGVKGAAKAAEAADAAKATRARRPGSANPGVEDAAFEEVHKADWELVGDPHNPMQIGKPKDRIGTNPPPKALPAPEAKKADIQKRLELNSVVRRENPVAPYSVIEQVNPEQARAMMQAIREGTDEVAEAFTGVSREQAMANATYPQIGTESGAVTYKVNLDLQEAVHNTGALRYTDEEYKSAVAHIQRDFRSATEMEINDAMTTFREDGDHLVIDAHYSPAGGSWTTPEAAKTQARYALREYGIKDDEIIVMKRDGMDYVPVGPNDAQTGDYIVKVRARVPVDDGMVEKWNPLDVKRNWADRISVLGSDTKGSIAGSMMDPGSMLHPTITKSFSVAEDQSVTLENMLLKPIKEFRTQISGFSKDRKAKINEYIIEANRNQIKFDQFDLIARGFQPEEINALKKWRDIWDNHYYLENYDLVRTLRGQGFEIFENRQHRLFGKRIQKNQNITQVFDPATGTVRTLPKAELDALYNQNGSLVQLRRPVDINGVTVEHMMVRNTPSEFMRGIRDTDRVLNYREGYYTVHYEKGVKFIDEIKMDASGKEVRTTVAVAGNTKDAEMFRDAQQQITGNRHEIREDSRGFKHDGDGYWDVNQAAGRIAQRLRGKPLVEATGVNHVGQATYVVNPMESAVRAAKSLSGRTLGRAPLETAKRRFIEQYGDLLPTNEMGMKVFPSSRSQLVDHANHTSKRLADARTTYDYINVMENGIINSADQLFHGVMRSIEGMFADKGMSRAEVAARKLGQTSPTHAAKSVVFQSYIAASLPIRQWLVQGHQTTRMIAYNPMGIVGTQQRIIGYLADMAKLGGPPSKDVASFIKFADESGMLAGVDRNSLVRGLGLAMSDSSSDVKRAVGMVLSAPQKYGFDIGEKFNQLGHLAAVHEKWTRKGLNLADKTIRDNALAEARALSYDLNRAGEFHYTQASAAAILQFLQMPHKALAQLSNRKLTLGDRYRMAAFDMVMFGAKGSVLGGLGYGLWAATHDEGDILPDDQDKRDKILYGAESWGANWMLTQMDDSGDKTRVDFSALAPFDLDGWARMYHTNMERGPMAAMAASPIGQMWAINGVNGARRNGRIPQAIITMGRFFNVFEEFDPENPTKFTDVLNDVAKITSAWSAASQAKLMLATRKKLDSVGSITDESVTLPEIWMQAGGFGKLSTKELYEISQSVSQSNKQHKEEVLAKYRDIVTYYTNALQVDNADIEHIQKVSSMLMRTFDSPEDLDLVYGQWQKDMAGKDMGLLKDMMEAAGHVNAEKHLDDVRKMNIPDDEKQLIIERIKDHKEVAAKVAEQNKQLGK